MYLEKKEREGALYYAICESYHDEGKIRKRTLFDLGTDPSQFIRYPGGNSYYVNEKIELSILERGFQIDTFDLEALFWPFLDQRYRRVLREPKNSKKREFRIYKRSELLEVQEKIHVFDKRRLHFLRFGKLNQREISNVPYRFFNRLLNMSREEIECVIDEGEKSLKKSQLKDYVYTVFNLQGYFNHPVALQAPHTLDQNRLEDYFQRELCLLNADRSFFGDENIGETLHHSLVKYLIMFFDNEFPERMYFDYFSTFSSRFYQELKKMEKTLSISEACRILNISETEYHQLLKKQLVKKFRKLAHKCHPDKGGSNKEFICLCEAYERLLEGKKDS